MYHEIVCKIDPDLTEITSESILFWFLGKFKNYKMPSEIFWPLKNTYYPDYLTLAWKLRWAWLLSTVFCRLWWFQLVNCMYLADLYVFMQIYVLKFYPCHLYMYNRHNYLAGQITFERIFSLRKLKVRHLLTNQNILD